MHKIASIPSTVGASVLIATLVACCVPQAMGFEPVDARSADGVAVDIAAVPTFRVFLDGQPPEWIEASSTGGVAGTGCPGPIVATHTDADFAGGEFIIQAGFAENETAAASYTVSAADFPIRLQSIEAVFAQRHAAVQTTTEWSVTIWDGYPGTGIVVGRYESDGDMLPHLVLDPGTHGANLQVTVAEDDPIYIYNESGLGVFSIGYTVEAHNAPSDFPCLIPPAESQNAFPTVDTSGLATRTDNWLYALNCGAVGCPPFWNRFSQLGVCEPSGDWVIRATYTCNPPVGACCNTSGLCFDLTTEADCESISGTWHRDVPCLVNPCEGVCPEATIISSSPTSGIVDARLPHDYTDNGASARQGIGSATEPIMINIGLPDADPECFALCESSPDPLLGANAISQVIESFLPGVYEIHLSHPIAPGAMTRVYYRDGSYVEYIAHPGNVNGDEAATAGDLYVLLAHLNDVAEAPFGLYSADVNRSGEVEPSDLITLIDLLNGAGVHNVWVDTPKPGAGACE